MKKIRIKINDKVQVMTGKDKGKIGKVLQILPAMDKLVVEGVNVMYKHLRPQKKGEKGQRVQFNGPLAVSNVLLLCPKCSKPARLGLRQSAEGARARFCKKCQEVID